jgi:hypothetical protein
MSMNLPKHEVSAFPWNPQDSFGQPDNVNGALIIRPNRNTTTENFSLPSQRFTEIAGVVLYIGHYDEKGQWHDKTTQPSGLRQYMEIPSRKLIAAIRYEQEPGESDDEFYVRQKRIEQDLLRQHFGEGVWIAHGVPVVRYARSRSISRSAMSFYEELSEVLTWEEIAAGNTLDLEHVPVEDMGYDPLQYLTEDLMEDPTYFFDNYP